MAKVDVDKVTKTSLAASPVVLGDAEVFLQWRGSLPNDDDAQILHYWGPWDELVKRLSSKVRPCGPGHQFVPLPTKRDLLRRVGELIAEVRRLPGTVRVNAWKTTRDVEELLQAGIAASPGAGDDAIVRRATALLEKRVDVVAKGGTLSVESVPADAYRSLQAEMAPESIREEGVLWKETPAGPLVCLRPGAGLHVAVDPEGQEVLIAEDNWNPKTSAADVLRQARASSKAERVLGTMAVSTGMIVMAKAPFSHHVLVPRAKDPLAAFGAVLSGAASGVLTVPKMGNVGQVVAVTPGSYEVAYGATDAVRWCRLRTKQPAAGKGKAQTRRLP
jgi:hypothetical protein